MPCRCALKAVLSSSKFLLIKELSLHQCSVLAGGNQYITFRMFFICALVLIAWSWAAVIRASVPIFRSPFVSHRYVPSRLASSGSVLMYCPCSGFSFQLEYFVSWLLSL